jgi:hypothetical protein
MSLASWPNPPFAHSVAAAAERVDTRSPTAELRANCAKPSHEHVPYANGRLELEHFPLTITGLAPRRGATLKLDGLSPSGPTLAQDWGAIALAHHAALTVTRGCWTSPAGVADPLCNVTHVVIVTRSA